MYQPVYGGELPDPIAGGGLQRILALTVAICHNDHTGQPHALTGGPLNQVANVAGGLAGVLFSILNNGQAGLAIAAALLTVALVMFVARHRVLAGRLDAEPYPARPRARRSLG